MKKIAFAAIFLLFAGLMSAQQTVDQLRKDKSSARVRIVTSMGEMEVLLFDDTPEHRANFLNLAMHHEYDSLLFHRVIQDFMIQAGDPDSRKAAPGKMLGNKSIGPTINAEIRPRYIHRKGALCAARMGDQVNPQKRSSGSQFYIVQGRRWSPDELAMLEGRTGRNFTEEQKRVYATEGGAPHLDGEYTIFGQVVEGFDVIDRIAAVATDRNNRPKEDVYILSVTVEKQ